MDALTSLKCRSIFFSDLELAGQRLSSSLSNTHLLHQEKYNSFLIDIPWHYFMEISNMHFWVHLLASDDLTLTNPFLKTTYKFLGNFLIPQTPNLVSSPSCHPPHEQENLTHNTNTHKMLGHFSENLRETGYKKCQPGVLQYTTLIKLLTLWCQTPRV